VLPDECNASIDLGSWPVPPLFQLVRDLATQLDAYELYRTLNMGIGMVVVCASDDVGAVQGLIDEPTWVIGRLVATENSERRVQLR
jgi:phosphoribosylformylglycinamidine cyclo-ligase